MPVNSIKITANTQVSSIGGTFDGIIYYNGGTASTVTVFDNNNADVLVPFNYNNDPTITTGVTAGLSVGMLVFGDGIPEGATIASITDPTTFELSVSTTGGSKTAEPLTFVSVDNPIGKFKIDANTSDDIRGLEIICRNGIKIVANNFTTLEVFALTN
jgi:hypothetical protein